MLSNTSNETVNLSSRRTSRILYDTLRLGPTTLKFVDNW